MRITFQVKSTETKMWLGLKGKWVKSRKAAARYTTVSHCMEDAKKAMYDADGMYEDLEIVVSGTKQVVDRHWVSGV